VLTLTGLRLSGLHPPVKLTFGTREGAEMVAEGLHILNDTHATARVPPYLAATSYVLADLSLTDSVGRAAYLFGAFTYEPGWEPYAVTLAIMAVIVVVGCCVVPAYIRGGCETSLRLFEWQTSAACSAEKPANGQRGPTGEAQELV